MRDSLFHVERDRTATLQAQIREMLVSAMLAGQLPASSPIPSTRVMARRLKVSRNTVMIAYQALAADGYLNARERSGFYVSPEIRSGYAALSDELSSKPADGDDLVGWTEKLKFRPTNQANITKPQDWHNYPYPFIYGQSDASLFPITAWRDCTRQAMSRKWLEAWTEDLFSEDDPMLVEQIRQRVLMRRGIRAEPKEVLVTVGAQNALYLIASLLVDRTTEIAVEDPGYPDMRNIFSMLSDRVRPVPVDKDGIRVDLLGNAKVVFVTPSHQFPTNATMSLPRRRELLEWAKTNDAIIIEDDYEYETNYVGEPTPALKSLDNTGRVLYVGSLSKSLMPGLRIGFLAAPAQLVSELRALRRLVLRHPPGNNQRVAALFLALGRHDALISRLHRAYGQRWKTLGAALQRYLPDWSQAPAFGGTSYWVKGPKSLDCRELAKRALDEGVLIETGDVHFFEPKENRNFFKLGFSSIPEERIDPGIKRLAAVAGRML